MPQLNINDETAMIFICSILETMNRRADIEELKGYLDNIIDVWEFNAGFPEALEAGFSSLYPFSNLYAKGKGINGKIQVKVNQTQVKESDGAITYGHWLSVHTAHFVVSKEIYNNLLRFSKQINYVTWKQRTDFKWQEKGLPAGGVGKVSLNKGNVFLLFESKIFGIFGKNDIVFGREDALW